MRELLAGGTIVLLSLLLFGCVGSQETAETEQTVEIGDRQIGVTEDEEDAPLYFEEDVIEPPEVPVETTEPGETTEPEEIPVVEEEPTAELSMSDIDVFDESDFDIMMEEDIIEP